MSSAMGSKPPNDQYSDEEATRRMNEALRRALTSPPKPPSEMKIKRYLIARELRRGLAQKSAGSRSRPRSRNRCPSAALPPRASARHERRRQIREHAKGSDVPEQRADEGHSRYIKCGESGGW